MNKKNNDNTMEKRIKRLGKCFFLTLGVLGAASLTGCAEDVSALFGSDGTAVEVTASVADAAGAMTRAADGLNGSGFTLTTEGNSESKVRVMVDKNDGDYSQFDYNVTGATTINRDSKPTFPSGVNSVNVYGWYPAKSLENFTVDDNQTGNNGYCLSDLLFAKGATCTRNSSTGEVENAASLTFNHVMAKVKVNLTLAEGVIVKSAKFKSMLRTVTVTATQSGNVVTDCSVGAASSAGDITLLTGGTLTNASSDADKLLCGVFPEQTKSGAFLEIVANYDGGSDQTITYSFDNSSSKTFDSGKEYLMNITLKGTDITTSTVSIANWGTAAGTVNIGGGALELAPTSLTMTYGDAAQTLTISGSVTIKSDGTTSFNVTSSDTNVATVSTTGTTVTVTPQNAGTATITVTDANKPGNTASCTVNVAKGTPSVTAPTYVASALTYNSSAQTLINAGTAPTGTTMQYALGTSSAATGDWGTSLSTATNAGTYYVWYKVEGGSNYNDVAATMISGSKAIGKATPTLSLSTNSLTFTSLNSQQTFTITYDGDGALSATSSNSSYATASLSSKTVTVTSKGWGSATITVSAAAGTNYKAATNQTVSVNVTQTVQHAALADATVGMIICEHGYANKEADPSGALSCGGKKIAIVAYKGNGEANTSWNNGLALSMEDLTSGADTKWRTSGSGTDLGAQYPNLNDACLADLNGLAYTNVLINNNSETDGVYKYPAAKKISDHRTSCSVPSGCSDWFLPTLGQWNLILKGLTNSSTNLSTSDNNTYKGSNINTILEGFGGASARMKSNSGSFWSSTELDADNAWYMVFFDGDADNRVKTVNNRVRAVLAF